MSQPRRRMLGTALSRRLTFTLILCSVLSLLAVTGGVRADLASASEPTTAAVGFTDTAATAHVAAIHQLAAEGIVFGCDATRFCPGDEVTRAQLAALLSRTLRLPVGPRSDFADVPADHSHADAIDAATHAGITTGTTDGHFRPGAPVTRGQAAAMIARAFDLASAASTPFTDVTGSPHADNIAAVAAAEITVGCRPQHFCPNATLTRGQAASLVQRSRNVAAGIPPVPTPSSPPASGVQMGLPDKVVGGYWTYWRAPRLRDVPASYNTIYLFSARPTGGQPGSDGSVFFEQSNQTHAQLVADIAQLRAQGRAVILSIGGAGEAVDITTNARRQAFLTSIQRINDNLGGIDGIDWNIEDDHLIRANTPNAVWVSQQLKATYGNDFAITTPPAPWRQSDIDFVTALNRNNALDLVAPQYYDHDSLTEANYVVDSINRWIGIVGDASKVGVGYRNVGPADHVMPVSRSIDTYRTLAQRHPTLRGAFVWEIEADRTIGYGFANQMSPVITP